MTDDRARWSVVDVPLRLSPSVRHDEALVGQSQRQQVAVCEAMGVVAVANGRAVDLYDSDACGWMRPRDADAGGLVDADAVAQLYLPFMAQISLGVHLPRLSTPRGRQTSDTRALLVTCVAFPTAGVLLVGGVAVDSVRGETDSFLLGFRLYATSVTRFSAPGDDRSDSKRAVPPRVTAHFSFLEPIKTAGFPVAMTVCHHMTTAQAGAVVLLMHGSSEIVVFSWTERFSSRQIAAASVVGRTAPLIAAVVSPDGRFVAVASKEGYIFLMDWSRFSALIGGEVSTSAPAVTGKRLLLGVCSRSGRVVGDNPLDSVRLVTTTRDGTDEFDHATILQWWRWSDSDRKRDYILIGKQDGSMSVLQLLKRSQAQDSFFQLKLLQLYPGPSSSQEDAIVAITQPRRAESSSTLEEAIIAYKFCIISRSKLRMWVIPVENKQAGEETCSDRSIIAWPSLKDSLEFNVVPLPSPATAAVLLADSSAMSSILSEVKSPVDSAKLQDAPNVVMVSSKSGLLLIARHNQRLAGAVSPTDPKVLHDHESDGAKPPIENKATEDVPQLEAKSDDDAACGDSTDATHPDNVPETIQAKYKLPPMELKPPVNESNASTKALEVQQDSESCVTPKVSRAEYEQRVADLAQRVNGLAATLKTMRTSFQIFSADVMEHMNALSRELEDQVGKCVAHS